MLGGLASGRSMFEASVLAIEGLSHPEQARGMRNQGEIRMIESLYSVIYGSFAAPTTVMGVVTVTLVGGRQMRSLQV